MGDGFLLIESIDKPVDPYAVVHFSKRQYSKSMKELADKILKILDSEKPLLKQLSDLWDLPEINDIEVAEDKPVDHILKTYDMAVTSDEGIIAFRLSNSAEANHERKG